VRFQHGFGKTENEAFRASEIAIMGKMLEPQRREKREEEEEREREE